ncbi:MAG: DegT/DnrJ/EryC1/StrS family aminotransferase [Verrucomicrobiota bacterium]
MKIPFLDLKKQHDPIRRQLHEAACRVIDSCHYIGGEEVKGFEQDMARWLGVQDVVGVACATSGLFAALKSLGVGPGDEVITTVHTAIATAEAVTLTGARPVFCEVRHGYFNLDPGEAARKITRKTKALLPVHLYGQPCEVDAFVALSRKHGIPLVEDCAQAQGARFRGQRVGTFGDLGVFSFFPSKNLGGFGDGGAVVARDPAVLKKVRMFSNHGRTSKYLHEFEGMNSRLDAIQAALLRVCLPHVDRWNELRRTVAKWYGERLREIAEVVRPRVTEGSEPVYHVYVILVPDRDSLQSYLSNRGIETGIHYPHALNTLPAYAYLDQGVGSFPEAEHDCAHMLSLPMSPVLTKDEVDHVCDAIRQYFAEKR